MDSNIQPYVQVNIQTASMTMSTSKFAVMAKLETFGK